MFFPIRDREVPGLVEHSDVPRMEPAVFVDRFFRGFGIVVIAQHDIRSLCQYLPVFRNLDLDARYRLPDCSKLIVVQPVCGKYGRGFRQSVSLNDLDPHGLKELPKHAGKRGPAGNEELDPSACPFFQL